MLVCSTSFCVRCGSLFLFIGEMEKDWEKDVVEFCPKVYRCVDYLTAYHLARGRVHQCYC